MHLCEFATASTCYVRAWSNGVSRGFIADVRLRTCTGKRVEKKNRLAKKKFFFGKCGITTASGREGTDGGICQLCVTNSTTTQQHRRIGVGRLPTVVGLKFVAWSWCVLWGSQQLQKHGWIGVGCKFTLTCTVRGLLRVECRGSPVCSRRLLTNSARRNKTRQREVA